MKNSINHLPQIKQDELQKIVAVIRQNCQSVEKIILFGSYARGDYKEAKDLKPDRKSGHISDYDLLVVTSTKEVALDSMLWKKISDNCKELNLSARPAIITHDIEALNIKLAEGQYFYSDVKKEGILLFDTNKYQLADQRELTSKEKQRIAQDYFDSWFKSATEFFETYEIMMNKEWYKKASFNLHQATESAYKTILLVCSNHNPAEHFLENLANDTKEFDQRLKNLFPQNTAEQEDRFRLFEYAYIGSRYDTEYFIYQEDLEILAKDVENLLAITKEICEDKINSFDI
jgi:predicted nucleotidyltransferase/HEPN domain-containing protein